MKGSSDTLVKRAIDTGVISANRNGVLFSGRTGKKMGGLNTKGYVVFTLHFEGVRKQIKAHRAVWVFFNGVPNEKTIIDHINGIKHDNRLSNLRLVTPKENSNNRRSYKGSDNPAAKISKTIADRIRLLYTKGESYDALAVHFGVSKTLVANIIRGELWV